MRPLLLSLLAVMVVACAPPAFEPSFLFGASVAGFQVDPGCPTLGVAQCEDHNSDWYQWVTSASELSDLATEMTFEPLAHGPGFAELYPQDLDRAKADLGLNAVRLSIEWSRVFPTATDGLVGDALAAAANPDALAYYHAQFQALKAHGMTPMVTLNHYTLPLWLHDGVACHKDLSTCTKRGWLDRTRAVTEAARYAGFVAKEFSSEVDLWATENEPFALVLPGYLLPSADRVNPPGLTLKFAEAREVIVALIEAHAAMYDAVKANDPTASVGLVYAMAPTTPKDPNSRLDVRAAQNLFYLYNTAFLDGVARGLVDADLDGHPDTATPRSDLVGRMDWLGINYYTRITIAGTGSATFPDFSALSTIDPTSLSIGEDYAPGLKDMAMFIHDRYALPMYITETGTDASGDPEKTASWVVRYVQQTHLARQAGADVRGFFYWSLMDNYEWNHGMALKFGLYEVGSDAAKTRTARPGVKVYADIIKARGVSTALLEQFP
jgi:beta-glucosidase/6-phospho-beta-glucosidase/beta-galactosidase